MNEAKAIREEPAYLGRYMSGISPKLSKYKELEVRRDELRKKLKRLVDKSSGTDPEPMRKADKGPYGVDFDVNYQPVRNVDRLTVRRKSTCCNAPLYYWDSGWGYKKDEERCSKCHKKAV